MEIAGAAEMAMVMKRSEYAQDLNMQMMKQSLQQDASVLQIVAAASQPPSPNPVLPAPPMGVGTQLDIIA